MQKNQADLFGWYPEVRTFDEVINSIFSDDRQLFDQCTNYKNISFLTVT